MNPRKSGSRQRGEPWKRRFQQTDSTVEQGIKEQERRKKETEENVERSTTDAPGNRGIARAEQGDHRDQAGKRGYYAVTRFPLPEPAFPPSQLAANFVVTRRNSPP